MIDCRLGEVCKAAHIKYFRSGASRLPDEAALDKGNIHFHMHDVLSKSSFEAEHAPFVPPLLQQTI